MSELVSKSVSEASIIDAEIERAIKKRVVNKKYLKELTKDGKRRYTLYVSYGDHTSCTELYDEFKKKMIFKINSDLTIKEKKGVVTYKVTRYYERDEND